MKLNIGVSSWQMFERHVHLIVTDHITAQGDGESEIGPKKVAVNSFISYNVFEYIR
jgi:hypothetical protein